MRYLTLVLVVLSCGLYQDTTGQDRSPAEVGAGGPVRPIDFAYFGNSQLDGVTYSFCTKWADFSSTPNWNKTDDFPPLSVRKAVSVALHEAKRIRPDVSNWTLESVTLDQLIGHWFYKVKYLRSDTVGTAIHESLEVPVLMDGTAVHGGVTSTR
jgi:hypothetical protein